jgi:hypothetical protein
MGIHLQREPTLLRIDQADQRNWRATHMHDQM